MTLRAKLWIAGIAVGAITGCASANAADYSPPEPVVSSPFTWSGLYFGGHGGYGGATYSGIFDNNELPDFPEDATYSADLDAKGFLGGAQAGFNGQSGSFVFGVEADVSLAGITDEVGDDDGDDVIKADLNVLASLRGRIGVAAGQALLYATGGLAYAGGEYTVIDDLGENDENSGTASLASFGGVVGGGVEVATGSNMSLRLEGLYYLFGSEVDTSELTDDSDDEDFLALDNVFVIRAGVNFRL